MALTFDDGPDRRYTPGLLDVLASWSTRATFFLTASQVPGNEYLLRRMVDEGHQVGTHGLDHVDLTTLEEREVREQLVTSRELIEAVTQVPTRLFRPPYGRVDETVARVAAEMDLDVVLWSLEGCDWEPVGPEAVAGRILTEVALGDVLLLHDGRKEHLSTGRVVEVLLGELRGRGLAAVELTDPGSS